MLRSRCRSGDSVVKLERCVTVKRESLSINMDVGVTGAADELLFFELSCDGDQKTNSSRRCRRRYTECVGEGAFVVPPFRQTPHEALYAIYYLYICSLRSHAGCFLQFSKTHYCG